MRDLEQQIAGKCIHFNGTVNEKCKKDIPYDSVKDKTIRPFTIPCLAHHGTKGAGCSHCEFPTLEEVRKQAKEIEDLTRDTLEGFKAIKDYYKKTKERTGHVDCSKCEGKLHYAVSTVNDHIHAKCDTCGIGWIE